jgi:prepilin-type N-terminal cleavage/methylation domain-containing protein
MSQNNSQNPAADIRGKERGFTLLEVMVAISILTFGFLAVASMQATSIRGNSFAGGVTEATTWAGYQVERLMALSYTDDDLSAGTHTDQEENYTITWNVDENVVFNNTKTIEVKVTWMDQGVQKNVSMQRVIPRII